MFSIRQQGWRRRCMPECGALFGCVLYTAYTFTRICILYIYMYYMLLLKLIVVYIHNIYIYTNVYIFSLCAIWERQQRRRACGGGVRRLATSLIRATLHTPNENIVCVALSPNIICWFLGGTFCGGGGDDGGGMRQGENVSVFSMRHGTRAREQSFASERRRARANNVALLIFILHTYT